MSQKISRHQKGNFAEWIACFYLRLKGWKILKRNYQHPSGEIDIIAQKKKVIIAVEVKYRKKMEDQPISYKQMQRIERSFDHYTQKRQKGDEEYRIDLILIIAPFKIFHYENYINNM